MKKRSIGIAYRSDPEATERALAALVSSRSSRVRIEQAEYDGNINGCYIPDADMIVLFPCQGNIPAICVALEEAGHSNARADYIALSLPMARLRARLQDYHPQAPILLDWMEDARIYNLLKAEYPGATDDLDYVWDRRRDSVSGVVVTTEELKRVGDELLHIISDYERGIALKSLEDIIAYLNKWLQQQPPSRWSQTPSDAGGKFLIGERGNINGKQAKIVIEAPGTVSIVFGLDASTQIAKQTSYPWPVIDRQVI